MFVGKALSIDRKCRYDWTVHLFFFYSLQLWSDPRHVYDSCNNQDIRPDSKNGMLNLVT